MSSFETVAPSLNERELLLDNPRASAMRLAEAKADEVKRRRPDALIIAADTLVECGGEVIGKPRDLADALRILRKLTRNPHRVITGVCVLAPDGRRRTVCAEARLWMKPMSETEMRAYVTRAGILQRAGAYAIEPNDPYVERLEGDVTTVMGLPLAELCRILEELYPAQASSQGRPS